LKTRLPFGYCRTRRDSRAGAFFQPGMSAGGIGVFSVYRTNGRLGSRAARTPVEAEERFFLSAESGSDTFAVIEKQNDFCP